MIPMESIVDIQSFVDEQTMTWVQIRLSQLMYELLQLQDKYKYDDSFMKHLIDADKSLEKDFRPLVEAKEEQWEDHVQVIRSAVKEEMTKQPCVIFGTKVPKKSPALLLYVHSVALSSSLSVLSRCIRHLDAKTREEAFLDTKVSLASAGQALQALVEKVKGQ